MEFSVRSVDTLVSTWNHTYSLTPIAFRRRCRRRICRRLGHCWRRHRRVYGVAVSVDTVAAAVAAVVAAAATIAISAAIACRDRSRSVSEIYRPLALARLYSESWIWYSLGIVCMKTMRAILWQKSIFRQIFGRKYLSPNLWKEGSFAKFESAMFRMRGNIFYS